MATVPLASMGEHERARTLLLLGMLAPRPGIVLLLGPRGAGKSTLVRSLETLLPGKRVLTVAPGISDEGLFGGLDWKAALDSGCRVFRPGLLSRASDPIVFLEDAGRMDAGLLHRILDVAETGRIRIERDGLSVEESVTFSLIAAVDAGEGGLSPALLDRFRLCMSLEDTQSLGRKKEVLSSHFKGGLRDGDVGLLKRRFEEAERRLPCMVFAEESLVAAVLEAVSRELAGQRGEAALARAAMAWAAWSGDDEVRARHVRDMARYALDHRTDRNPASGSSVTQEGPREHPASADPLSSGKSSPATHGPGGAPAKSGESAGKGSGDPPERSREGTEAGKSRETQAGESRQEALEGYSGPKPAGGLPSRSVTGSKGGRRHADRASLRQGRSQGGSGRLQGRVDWDATLKRALLFRKSRPAGALRIVVRPEDIRIKTPKGPVGRILLFLVDASGSMGARRRMAAVKGSVRSALHRAYLSRDRVAMMVFRDRECRLLFPPTRSSHLADRLLSDIVTGGGTPLALGLRHALDFGRKLKLREPATPLRVLLFTDGRANISLTGKDPVQEALDFSVRAGREGWAFTVVDTEAGYVRLGLAAELARLLRARYSRLEELRN